MGWDFLISSFIADLIVNRKDKKAFNAPPQPGTIKTAVAERMFINSKKKTVVAEYTPILLEWFDDPETYHQPLPLFILDENQKDKLHYYFSILSSNPNSIDIRTALIHYLFGLWKNETKAGIIDLLQNELLYIIDYYSPLSQQERMYKHLSMFLSSECYFFKGDFSNALKRLFQTLDWQEIYDNVEEKGGIDFNGLSKFHESVVANIINIYALVGLPDKANEMRTACRLVVSEARSSYRDISSSYSNDSIMSEFLNNSSNVLLAQNKFKGYYLFGHTWYNENFYKEICTAVIRGQAIYSIETLLQQPKDITYENAKGIYNDVFGSYPSLCFRYNGAVINYEAAVEKCLDDIRNI